MKATVMKKQTNGLYRAARRSNDLETLLTGNPKKVLRRAKNKLLGRLLAKLKIWR